VAGATRGATTVSALGIRSYVKNGFDLVGKELPVIRSLVLARQPFRVVRLYEMSLLNLMLEYG
jgi:hypothetical protein